MAWFAWGTGGPSFEGPIPDKTRGPRREKGRAGTARADGGAGGLGPIPWLPHWEWEELGLGAGDEATERQGQHRGLMSQKGVV